MSNQIQPTVQTDTAEIPGGSLHHTYHEQQALFEAQPASVQRFLAMQGRALAEALSQGASHVRFHLTDRVVLDRSGQITPVPGDQLEQHVGGLMTSLVQTDLPKSLRSLLAELENTQNLAVAAAGQLVRYATAHAMVHDLLPSGRAVTYRAADDEAIPSIPVIEAGEAASAITAASDAIAEDNGAQEAVRDELLVPYVPAARRFYLPQWVAFDEDGKLLVKSLQEAESVIASMQRFLSVLHGAVGLAPYMVADDEYQRKRYGMLGQLVNQGRALARFQTEEIIRRIQKRTTAHDLNRGLSLSLPYFDDQDLAVKLHHFQVVPAGRIMFNPLFVVRAAHEQQAKVAQDTRLGPSTRRHLLEELSRLQQAFQPVD